ncbi:MAG: hypothetical protein CVV27_16725 [Candidatus Melainabacteria bacterium HGW-Melainabacteria-1]|nr:MAG: hypothetical protein CVV27_16725 [Candidatus Melainabacteria bacterium HGW-Melainabacteria-1]
MQFGLKTSLTFFAATVCLAMPPMFPVQAQSAVQSVPFVDLKLYTGSWYEIASFETMFQDRDCAGTSATYTLNPDGTIKVWNQCYVPTFNGYRLDRIEGRAWVAEPNSQARLKVSFFGPFEGDYWVLALDENYQYALVGAPNRNYLWVLSRDPVMSESVYQSLLDTARSQGFDVSRLRLTPSREQGLNQGSARANSQVR